MIEFDWDDHNIGHLAKHDVTPAEFEFILNDPRTAALNYQIADNGEPRFRVVGMTRHGRLLAVVYTVS